MRSAAMDRFGLEKLTMRQVAWTAAFTVFLLFWSYPPALTVISSFKTSQEILLSPFSLPSSLNLDNYYRAWEILSYDTLIWNSILYGVTGSVFSIALAIVPATIFAWMPLPGRAVLFVLLMTPMMLPQQTVIIPLFDLLRAMGLLDTRTGLIIVHVAYGIPLQLLILTAFISGIPRDLASAARVDGCSEFGVIRYVVLPLSVPAMAVGFALSFIEIWKEFFFALILVSTQDFMPVNVGILRMTSEHYFSSMNLPAAAVVLAQLPTIVLFTFSYRAITRGFFTGSVKG